MKANFDHDEIVAMLNKDYIPVMCEDHAAPNLTLAARAMAQIMMGHAGWPLFLFLTPKCEPIFASSYMPQQSNSPVTPGMLEVLRRIKWLWLMKRPQINEAASSYSAQLNEAVSPFAETLEGELRTRVLSMLYSEADEAGGWRGAPKFPQAPKIFLETWLSRTSQDDVSLKKHIEKTVKALTESSLHDLLGGGFFDYCREADWTQPYLGKRAAQNCIVLLALLECWRVTRDASLLKIVRNGVDFVKRRFANEKGILCTGEDIGASQELESYYLLNKGVCDALLTASSHSLSYEEYTDPFTRQRSGKYLLSYGGAAAEVDVVSPSVPEIAGRRLPPLEKSCLLRDNAYFVVLLARVARHSDDTCLYDEAVRACTAMDSNFCQGGIFYHAVYDEKPEGAMTLEDASTLLWAELELYRFGREETRLKRAAEIAESILTRFDGNGALNLVERAENELLSACDAGDDFLPSANGVMTNNLITLGRLTGNDSWSKKAKSIVDSFGGALNRYPTTCAELALAALRMSEAKFMNV